MKTVAKNRHANQREMQNRKYLGGTKKSKYGL